MNLLREGILLTLISYLDWKNSWPEKQASRVMAAVPKRAFMTPAVSTGILGSVPSTVSMRAGWREGLFQLTDNRFHDSDL